MSHEVETMAYNRIEVPWHGLGTSVDSDLTPDEMLVAAGLNWKVQKRYLRMKVNPSTEETMIVPSYMAIVRDFDNQVFQVASDRYKPIQNADVLKFFKEYVEAGGMTMETAGSLKTGSIIWGLAKIHSDFTLAGGDKVGGYLLLANSHDGSLAFTAQFTSIRVVCWNTLSSALSTKGAHMFHMKHSKKFTPAIAADAKLKLGMAVEECRQLGTVGLALSKVKAPRELVRAFIMRLVQESKIAEIQASVSLPKLLTAPGEDTFIPIDQVWGAKVVEDDLSRSGRAIESAIYNAPGASMDSAKGTWWGALNGLTYWCDHAVHDSGKISGTSLASSWFGVKAQLKQKALDLAMAYARVR